MGRGVRWGCADLGVLLLPCRLSPSPTTRPRSLLPLCPQPCSDHVPICVDSEPPAPRKLMTTQAPTSRGPYSTSNPRPPRPLSHSKKPTQVASACRMKQLEVARGGAQGFWISPRPSRGLLPPPQCLDRKGAVATPWGRLPAPGIGGGGPMGVLTTARGSFLGSAGPGHGGGGSHGGPDHSRGAFLAGGRGGGTTGCRSEPGRVRWMVGGASSPRRPAAEASVEAGVSLTVHTAQPATSALGPHSLGGPSL